MGFACGFIVNGRDVERERERECKSEREWREEHLGRET